MMKGMAEGRLSVRLPLGERGKILQRGASAREQIIVVNLSRVVIKT